LQSFVTNSNQNESQSDIVESNIDFEISSTINCKPTNREIARRRTPFADTTTSYISELASPFAKTSISQALF